MGKLASKIKQKWVTLSIETMYVTAIRLYDLGLKDEAVFWFHSAQYRARFFASVLPPELKGSIGDPAFENSSAHHAFHELAGIYIDGYAFGELSKLKATLRHVKSEGRRLPQLRLSYPNVTFIADESWPERNKQIGEDLDKLIAFITSNADEIKSKRKANGIERKY
jgi:hypothetical protein